MLSSLRLPLTFPPFAALLPPRFLLLFMSFLRINPLVKAPAGLNAGSAPSAVAGVLKDGLVGARGVEQGGNGSDGEGMRRAGWLGSLCLYSYSPVGFVC